MKPLISIITPYYNQERFLGEAIESVIAQSYEEWELLLVDDGSTDRSSQIAAEYALQYPGKIRCLTHPGKVNLGCSASRNLGRMQAQGVWIANLDSDDVWLPRKLENQVRLAEAYPEAGVLLGATIYWHSWSAESKIQAADRVVPVGGPQDCQVQPPSLAEFLYPLGEGAAPSMNTCLIKAEVLERVGGWEESFPRAFEDQALLAKLYLTVPVYISSQIYDKYRIHSSSISATELTGAHYNKNRKSFLLWLRVYLQCHGHEETVTFKLLDRRLVSLSKPKSALTAIVMRLGRASRRMFAGVSGRFKSLVSRQEMLVGGHAYYEQLFTRNPAYNRREPNADELLRWKHISRYLHLALTRLPSPSATPTVVDFGCGRGWMVELLSERVRAIGIEPVEAVVAHARKLYPSEDIRCGSLEVLESMEDRVSVIVATEVLEHIPVEERVKHMQAFRRSLIDGGLLILTTPRAETRGAWSRYENPGQPLEDWLSEEDLRILACAAGLDPLQHERFADRPVRHGPLIDVYQIWLLVKRPDVNWTNK